MIAETTEHAELARDVLVTSIPAAIAAVAAILAAIIATGARRDAGRARDTAADAKAYADTGNAKTLGETAHDTNQTVEIVAALVHTNTKELIQLGDRVERHEQLLQDHINDAAAVLAEHVAEASAVHARMTDFLDRREEQEEAP